MVCYDFAPLWGDALELLGQLLKQRFELVLGFEKIAPIVGFVGRVEFDEVFAKEGD